MSEEPKNTVGGPMFQPAETELTKSIFRKEGGHYNISALKTMDKGMELLRCYFEDGEANPLNFCLFSTGGVHGCYTTLEEIEEGLTKYPDGPPRDDDGDWPDDYHGDDVTFVIVQPRLVAMVYGNARVTLADMPYLKKLRASSWAAVQKIGASRER